MYKYLIIILFLISFGCNHNKPKKSISIEHKNVDNLIIQFDTPEELLASYYNSIKQGRFDQILVCLGLDSISEINYQKLPGINYEIISKEVSHDSILSNDENWIFPELFITTKDSIDFVSGHIHQFYLVGKKNHSWIIMSHSSEIEVQMQDSEMDGAENATRIWDSIQNAQKETK